MTPAEHMAAWEQRNKERWVGLTCPVFHGKPEDVPARFRHYPFMVATITIKGLEEFIRDTQTKETLTVEAPSAQPTQQRPM